MGDINEMINVPVNIEPVSFNYEEAKERLTEMLEPYKKLVVTEDNYKLCKEKKDEVGRIGKELDDTRKAIKKAYEKPLKDFEADIKRLVLMTEKVKKDITSQLNVFDDRRRAEKKQVAESIMDEVIAEYELNEKYAGQVEFKKSYMNLTAKEADVRTDVEAQCMALRQQQDNEESIKKTIVNAVEAQNKGIVAKLVPDVYISLIGKMPTDEIIDRILKRGEEIWKMEKEAEKKKASQEDVTQQESEEKPKVEEQVQKQEKVPVNVSNDIYKVTFVVTGSEEQQKSVSRFLKENGISYSVEMQVIIS